MKTLLCLTSLLALNLPAFAHDAWIEADVPDQAGDPVAIHLKLGNHGNHHRDFKLAGKVNPETITFDLIAPDGSRTDLKPRLQETATDADEPYWTLTVQPDAPGTYMVACLDDKVVHYAPKRSIKSAKTWFRIGDDDSGPAPALGHPLELVALTDTTSADTETPILVQLLLHGKPLADTRVSFIPHGVELDEHFDPRYEVMTDETGRASFTPPRANLYLIVSHHEDPSASGDGYKATKYSATLIVQVADRP